MKHRLWMRLMVMLALLVATTGLAPLVSPAQAQPPAVWYVDTGASGDDTGVSWDHAFTDLQAALAAASPQDEIWVAEGTYTPTPGADRSVSFKLRDGVGLYGGFAGTETSREERNWILYTTTLSGDLAGDDGTDFANNDENSYQVVTSSGVTETAVLDGFSITSGHADGSYPNYLGSGMYNINSSPTLSHVTFQSNEADDGGGMANIASNPTLENVTFQDNKATDGGGLYNAVSSSPILTDVTFQGNTSSFGGGMYNDSSSPTLTNVTLKNNEADYGGGMYNADRSSLTLSSVSFQGNSATNSGGGMHNYFSNPTLSNVSFQSNSTIINGGGMLNYFSNPTLSNVSFQDNEADRGGAIFNDSSSPALSNVSFEENVASDNGGGMYNYDSSPALSNVTFHGNSVTFNGAGMYNDSSSPTLTNVTFHGNVALRFGGGIDNDNSNPTLSNTILWGNAAGYGGDQIYNDSSTPTIAYSDVQGSGGSGAGWNAALGADGGGNIDAGPLFVDAAGSDLRLQLTSPAIDAGDNNAVPPGITTDLGGHPRFVDIAAVPDTGNGGAPLVDMGAYEAPPPMIYVDVDAGTSRAQDGSSWASALTDLHTALGWAVPGVEVWVAEGTYTPTPGTDRSMSFPLQTGVAVYGGFAGTETSREERDWTLYPTVLSGDLAGDDGPEFANNAENSYTVVSSSGVTETAVLDGFTITGGAGSDGGGMDNRQSSPTLSNLTFQGNEAALYGGGMYNADSNPTLTNISFHGNAATYGGGMYNEFSSPTLTIVTFQDNAALEEGGGMYNLDSSPRLTNVSFLGNAALEGGGISNEFSSNPTLTNISFAGNSAGYGGGINNDNSNPTLGNAILWGNSADYGGDQMYNDDSSAPTIAYSDIQGSGGSGAGWNAALGADGGGNIDADPRFVDAAADDLRLQLISPAIDAGDNSAVPPGVTTDLDGQPRFADIASVPDTGNGGAPLVDMGAYEAQSLVVYLPLMVRGTP